MGSNSAGYMGWFDDRPKVAIAARIAQGRQAHIDRFGTAPAFVLVNEADAQGLVVEGMGVLVKTFVRRNNYWFGMSDC